MTCTEEMYQAFKAAAYGPESENETMKDSLMNGIETATDIAVAETQACYNAVISFVLDYKTEEGEAFLRCWNEGDFDACRREWPEAPAECYRGADPLFKE